MFKREFILGIILLSAIGCGKSKPDVIKIGSVIPLTGENAFWGSNIKNGVDLAVDEINRNRGILGKKIEVVYEDTQGKPTIGTQAVSKLISADKVQAIIGDVISTVILAVAPIVEKNKVVLIGFGESAEITNAGDYIFRNWNSAASDAKITGEYAAKHSKKMVVFSQNDAFGKSAKSLFVQEIKRRNVDIVVEDEFAKGQTDFRTLIAKIKPLKFDAIYVASFHQEALAFLRQYKEMGLPGVNIYGVSSWEEGLLIDFIKINFPGKVFYGYPRPPDPTDPVVARFVANYESRYGKRPEILCDNGYDALYMLKYGIEKAGAYNGERIKAALYTLTDFHGASGTMSFDRNGDVDKPFGLKTITESGAGWVTQ